jgi:hypothetical protein
MALICSQLFSGEVMSSFLMWAKLCAGKSAISFSIYAQNAGDFIRRRRQGYALSNTYACIIFFLQPLWIASPLHNSWNGIWNIHQRAHVINNVCPNKR